LLQNVALTIYSGMVAQKMSMDAAAVKAEWVAGLIPGRAGRAVGRARGRTRSGEGLRVLLRRLRRMVIR